MPGGGGPKKTVGALLVGVALVTLAGCSQDQNDNNPPPPPAAFGQVHDWGGGSTVAIETPRDVQAPGLVPSGNQNIMAFTVTVKNGTAQPVALNAFPVEVKLNGQTVSAAAVGGYNTAQVLSNGGTATFVEVAEAPDAGAKVDVTVQGPNLAPVTYEGYSPVAK